MTKGAKRIILLPSLFIMFLLFTPKVSAAANFQVYFNKAAIHNKFLEVYPEQTEIVNYTIEQLNKNNIPYYIYLTHVPGYPSQTKFVVTLYKQNNLVKDFYYSFDNSYYYLYFNEKMQTEYDSYYFTIPTTGVCVEKALINSYIDDYKNGNSEFKHTDKPSGFNNYIRTWLSNSPTSGSTVNVTGGFLTRNNSNQRGTNFLYSTNLKYNYVEGKTSDIIKLLDDKGNVTDDPFSLITPIKEETITFELGNVYLNDDLTIKEYEVKTHFNLYDTSKYYYYYKFSDDDDFSEIKSVENKTFIYKFIQNGTLIVNVKDKETGKNISKSFSSSRIGEVYSSDMNFENVFDDDHKPLDIEDFKVTEDMEVNENTAVNFLSSIQRAFLTRFPIINQLIFLKSIFTDFKIQDDHTCHTMGNILKYDPETDTVYRDLGARDYCIPKIHIDFSKVGINKQFQIFGDDFQRVYLPYRSKVMDILNFSIITFTIFKCFKMINIFRNGGGN